MDGANRVKGMEVENGRVAWKNGKGMARYMSVNGRTFGIGLMGGRGSEVLRACGRVERVQWLKGWKG